MRSWRPDDRSACRITSYNVCYTKLLRVDIGHTELGNAEGFVAEKFLSFEEASLSVRIVPLIIRQEIEVGTASLQGLTVNLEVAANGTTNWDDLAQRGEAASYNFV